jgi:hypothetical protein
MRKMSTRMFETIITTDSRIRAVLLAILLNRPLGGVKCTVIAGRAEAEAEVSGDGDSDSDSGCHVYESSLGATTTMHQRL